jgi:hypothetical protein
MEHGALVKYWLASLWGISIEVAAETYDANATEDTEHVTLMIVELWLELVTAGGGA